MILSIKKKELQKLLKLLKTICGDEDLAALHDKVEALAKKNKIIASDDASSDEDQSGDLFHDSSSS